MTTHLFHWEEIEEGYWHLLDIDDKLIGEIYPRGNGFRWHEKKSDWRQWEETPALAKNNLLERAIKENQAASSKSE